MSLVRSSWSVLVSALSLGAFVGAQVVSLPGVGPGQVRDTGGPQQPTERRVPVGNASISGTVFAADTGQPVRGARVSVTGQVTVNAAAGAPARGGVMGAPGVGSAPPFGTAPPVGGMRGGVNVVNGASTSVSRTVLTDASGQFSFPRMPAGQFMLSASHSRFLQTSYGQRRTGGQGTYLQLTDGQPLTVKVPMLRGAVITGTVRGPDGEPQPNAQVMSWRFTMNNGVRRLQQSGYASTDDRGAYRMYGLQPGDYYISATPNPSDAMNAERFEAQNEAVERAIASGQVIPPAAPGLPQTVSVPIPPPPAPGPSMNAPAMYLPTFAPSSPTPSGASTVTVAGGEEHVGIDVFVRLTRATNVTGEVQAPADPGVSVQLSLISEDPSIDAAPTNSARVGQNGKFAFHNVRPGKYTVFAQTVPAPQQMTIVNGQPQPQTPPVLTDAQKMWGRAQVVVAGEPTVDVNLALRPSRTISGIVVFEMERPPDLSRARLSVNLATAPSAQQAFFSSPPQAQVGPDGRFTLTGVVPGRWIIRASGLMKSSVVDGQDTLDFPLDFTGDRDITGAVLTMKDQSSELSGTITDTMGKPAVDYTIVVAASDSRYWTPGSRRILLTRPAPDGRYTARNLPPGSYMVAAVVDPENGVQYDPEFLRSLPAASVAVTVLEGGKVVQDIRVK